jgi:hypothetical protein
MSNLGIYFFSNILTANKHGSISRGSRDDDLLGTSSQVSLALVDGGEHTGGLNNVVGSRGSPFDVGRIPLSKDIDGVAVDNELAILGLNGTLEFTVGGVILQEIDHYCR